LNVRWYTSYELNINDFNSPAEKTQRQENSNEISGWTSEKLTPKE